MTPDVDATQMIFEERDGEAVGTVEYLVSAGRVLVRSAGGDDVALYDRCRDELWVLQASDDALRPISRAGTRAVADKVRDGVNALESRWETLPPAEADRARADLDRLLGARPSLPPIDTAVATGDHSRVAAYPCTGYRLEASGRPLGSACIADSGNIPFETTLLAMFRLVAQVYTTIGGAGGGVLEAGALGTPLLPEHLLTGLPLTVEIRDDAGWTLRALELTSVASLQLRHERFALPEPPAS